ncbi:hypothetical protein JD276_04235 [Leucobacter sp. CSA1]|uniref:Uncharacterized protein n=1 Tax=Leucobacter chromiisoli TaxID=2796471 RepID=A0A934Q5W2_9MICO|nr:hypothetical protein [Leucobacter chromiisoli]MBK0418238.1 hypothetical protein [Leucobacter chromiisoli]
MELVFDLAEAINIGFGAVAGAAAGETAGASVALFRERLADRGARRRLTQALTAEIRHTPSLGEGLRQRLTELAGERNLAALLHPGETELTDAQREWQRLLGDRPEALVDDLNARLRQAGTDAIVSTLPLEGRLLHARVGDIQERLERSEVRDSRREALLEELNARLAGLQRDLQHLIEGAGAASVSAVSASDAASHHRTSVIERLAAEEFRGRERELAAIAEFVAPRGDDGGQWWWWLAGPWAGKTALMARLALRPPAGARVASAFIIGRQPAYADSDALYAALMPQLALIAGIDRGDFPNEAQSRSLIFAQLLTLAAARASEQGERLLLLVDGLDEDQGPLLPTPKPSVASSLPERLPHNVRVVIASRSNPPLPPDLGDDHPLRSVRRRELETSPVASAAERRATDEIDRILDTADRHGSRYGRDALACLAAAGTALTARDLAELTGQHPRDLGRLMSSTSGRSFTVAESPDGAPAYSLGHDMLDRVVVTDHLETRVRGPEETAVSGTEAEAELRRYRADRFAALSPWRERLARWGAEWAEHGWPEETPDYLLSPTYPALLCSDAALQGQAVSVVCDDRRIERLRARDHGEGEVLGQLAEMARSLLEHWAGAGDGFDRLGEVLRYLHLYSLRNSRFPLELPAGFARLGQEQEALGLAASVPLPRRRATALTHVSETLIEVGRTALALRAARDALAAVNTIDDPEDRCSALAELLPVLARAGDPEAAESALRDAVDGSRAIAYAPVRGRALVSVAAALLDAGQTEVARDVARDALETSREALTVALDVADKTGNGTGIGGAEVVMRNALQLLASAGEPEEALREARGIKNPSLFAETLALLAGVASRTGDAASADSLCREAASTVEALSSLETDDGDFYRWGIASVIAPLLVDAGSADLGVGLAREIPWDGMRGRTMVEAVSALVRSGNTEGARRLAPEALVSVRAIHHEWTRYSVLHAAVSVLADLGDPDAAYEALREIPEEQRWQDVRAGVVASLARGGSAARALELAREIPVGEERSAALCGSALILSERGEAETALPALREALDAARSGTGVYRQDEEIVDAAPDLVAVYGAETAIAEARGLDAAVQRGRAFAGIAHALASGGERKAAVGAVWEALAEACVVGEDFDRSRPPADVVPVLRRAEDEDRALGELGAKSRVMLREEVLAALAPAVAALGESSAALELARSITDDSRRCRAMGSAARALRDVPDAVSEARAAILSIASVWMRPTRDNLPGVWRDRSMVRVVLALADLGDIDAAREAADLLDPGTALVHGLAGVARGLAEARGHDALPDVLEALDMLEDVLRWAASVGPGHHRDMELDAAVDALVLVVEAITTIEKRSAPNELRPAAEGTATLGARVPPLEEPLRSLDELRARAARLLGEMWVAMGHPWAGWRALAALAPDAFARVVDERLLSAA